MRSFSRLLKFTENNSMKDRNVLLARRIDKKICLVGGSTRNFSVWDFVTGLLGKYFRGDGKEAPSSTEKNKITGVSNPSSGYPQNQHAMGQQHQYPGSPPGYRGQPASYGQGTGSGNPGSVGQQYPNQSSQRPENKS